MSSPLKVFSARFVLPITQPVIEDGAIALEEGRIVEIGAHDAIHAKYPDASREDFSQCVLLPGLVNAHAQIEMLNFIEGGASVNYYNWLMAGWDYRMRLAPSDRRRCLEEGIRQLVHSGTTTVGDVGRYTGIIPQAANAPIRMVLFPEILTGEGSLVSEDYETVFSQVEEILGTRAPRLGSGLAPFAAYTLSRHLLKVIAEQGAALRIPVKIHVSETFAEMQFFYESKGEIADRLFPRIGWSELPPEHRKTPVQFLQSIGFLENAPILIGCNHLSDPDLKILAAAGCKVVHTPRANAHLKLGTPPLKKLKGSGITVALGTDGTVDSLSLWDEMRHLLSHSSEGEKLDAEELLRMATLGGARALGVADRIGSLDRGKEADLIAVRVPKELKADEVARWLIANVTPREIAAVFVEGNRVKV